MSESPLAALVAQWREHSKRMAHGNNVEEAQSYAYDTCADDLEAALGLAGRAPRSELAQAAQAAGEAMQAMGDTLRAGREPQAPEWQPIETAPKDGRDVLLTNGHWTRTGYWAKRIETWSVDTAGLLKPPTHWMPLPRPPAEGRAGRPAAPQEKE